MHFDPVVNDYYTDPTERLSRCKAIEFFSGNNFIHFISFPWVDFVRALDSTPSLARFLEIKLRSLVARNLTFGGEIFTVCSVRDMTKISSFMLELGITRVYTPHWNENRVSEIYRNYGLIINAMPFAPESFKDLFYQELEIGSDYFYFETRSGRHENMSFFTENKELKLVSHNTVSVCTRNDPISSCYRYVLIDRTSDRFLEVLWSTIYAECIPLVLSRNDFNFSLNGENVDLWNRAIIKINVFNPTNIDLTQVLTKLDLSDSERNLNAVLNLKYLYGAQTFFHDLYIESIECSYHHIEEIMLFLSNISDLKKVDDKLFKQALINFSLAYKYDKYLLCLLNESTISLNLSVHELKESCFFRQSFNR